MLSLLLGNISNAFTMLLDGNEQLWEIIFLSLYCTFFACLGASLIAIPSALLLSANSFCGKRVILTILSSLQALPTVVIGLFLYLFISRRGVFGVLDLLYTPTAIIVGQCILLLPLLTMFLFSALNRYDSQYREAAISLGASSFKAHLCVLREARVALIAALCAAFGRGIGEVGLSMMLGGNIQGYTRTMTTAMALEYDKGDFSFALGLGLVLMLVSLILNALLGMLQKQL